MGKRTGFGSLMLGGIFLLVWCLFIYMGTPHWQAVYLGSGFFAAVAGGVIFIVGGLIAKGFFGLAGGKNQKRRAERGFFGLAAHKAVEGRERKRRILPRRQNGTKRGWRSWKRN